MTDHQIMGALIGVTALLLAFALAMTVANVVASIIQDRRHARDWARLDAEWEQRRGRIMTRGFNPDEAR